MKDLGTFAQEFGSLAQKFVTGKKDVMWFWQGMSDHLAGNIRTTCNPPMSPVLYHFLEIL